MGSGNCSFWAPGVFDLDDDGVAIVIDPDGAPEDKIVLAAQVRAGGADPTGRSALGRFALELGHREPS